METAAALEQYRNLRRQALSAAFLARQRSSFPLETPRLAPRAQVALPVTLHQGEWETDTHTLDLSEGGCAFLANHAPTQGDFQISIELQRGLVLRCPVQVVGCMLVGARHRVSVRFLRLSDDQRSALETTVLQALLAAGNE